MAGWFQNLLKDTAAGFFGSDYLRDYTHASKAFRTNNYEFAPKFKYLFHVYFQINQQVYDIDGSTSTAQNFGILVRDIKLPAFNIQTSQMNQYNRKRIVQHKIRYEPIQITFYDDNNNNMAKLWSNYYTYYYYDGSVPDVKVFGGKAGAKGQDLGSKLTSGAVRGLGGRSGAPNSADSSRYYERTQYNPSITGNANWGYVGESNTEKKAPFFTDITVFGFYSHNFIAYTLINPVITNFAHDTYDYEQGTGIMKNTMTIDYETVVYNEGQMAGDAPGNMVPGFGDPSVYDRERSPIAMPGSNNTVLGQGGLVDGITGAVKSLKSGGVGGILGAVKQAGATYKTFKNTNILSTLKNDLKNSFLNNLKANPDQTRNLNFNVGAAGQTPGSATQAAAPATGQVGGTQSTPTTGQTNGTGVNVGASGSPSLPTSGPAGTVPSPAGKQSTSGSGVNLPPTGG